MRFRFVAPAAVLAASLAVGGTAVASTASAASASGLRVSVTWRHGHATEIVRVTSDPAHRRVQATGICDSTGYWVMGRVLHGRGVTSVHCPQAFWQTAGYFTGQGRRGVYHSELGTKTLF